MDKDAIIVTGNPADGFVFIGPFAERGDCIEFADRAQYNGLDGDWWVIPLTSPEEFTGDESTDELLDPEGSGYVHEPPWDKR